MPDTALYIPDAIGDGYLHIWFVEVLSSPYSIAHKSYSVIDARLIDLVYIGFALDEQSINKKLSDKDKKTAIEAHKVCRTHAQFVTRYCEISAVWKAEAAKMEKLCLETMLHYENTAKGWKKYGKKVENLERAIQRYFR